MKVMNKTDLAGLLVPDGTMVFVCNDQLIYYYEISLDADDIHEGTNAIENDNGGYFVEC